MHKEPFGYRVTHQGYLLMSSSKFIEQKRKTKMLENKTLVQVRVPQKGLSVIDSYTQPNLDKNCIEQKRKLIIQKFSCKTKNSIKL